MNVSLTPQLEKMIRSEIRSGRYQSASEVVRQALRMFQEARQTPPEHVAWLRTEIQKGIDQADQGRLFAVHGRRGLRNLFEDVKRRGRQRLKKKPASRSSGNGNR